MKLSPAACAVLKDAEIVCITDLHIHINTTHAPSVIIELEDFVAQVKGPVGKCASASLSAQLAMAGFVLPDSAPVH